MSPLYFAYGSNMSSERLHARIPAARALGAARIDGHRLVCNKRGKDGSGKANLVVEPGAHSSAWGVLFALPSLAWLELDRHEWGYVRHECSVSLNAGERREAQLYLAVAPEPQAIAPFDWYRDYCLVGAREHALPQAVIDEIAGWSVCAAPPESR